MTRPARVRLVIAAWLLTLVLVGAGTLGALQGLRALEPSAPARLEFAHGVIVSIRGNDEFAVRELKRSGVVWFQIAHGSHISLAHLRRHLAEQAPTDIFYQSQPHGPPVAWLAD